MTERERPGVLIHPTAEVADRARIGEGTRIWHQAQVREGAVIGRDCILGKGVFVDLNVRIGDCCKLQNGVFAYHGFTIEDGVFLGPGVMLLNDKNPRAINVDGTLKTDADWEVSDGRIKYGAGVGGGAVILPGVTVGRFAIVGAGAVVSRDVPDYGMVYGNPARLHGFVCPCGHSLTLVSVDRQNARMRCTACQTEIDLPLADYRLLPHDGKVTIASAIF